jgi:chromosomal replication initiator protein
VLNLEISSEIRKNAEAYEHCGQSVNTPDISALWKQAVARLRQETQDENIGIWLDPAEALRLENEILFLKVPNKLFADGIRDRYQKKLGALLKADLTYEPGFEFEVSRDLRAVLPPTDPIPEPGPQSDFQASDLNPRYTFSSFVVGASNRFAQATAESISKNPGNQFNPYFIYGGVGLGKTHLMHAIGNAVRKEHPRFRVLYITAEQFVNEYITSIQNRKTEEFRAKYRNLDCLLMDDVQFLIAKERSEEEFFHTFNSLFNSRKQIVMSSDRSPKEMSPSEQRIISRLEWGVVADIKAPDLETRIAILRKKAEAEQFHVPDDIVVFLASAVKSNIRVLEGSLIRLKAFSCMSGSSLTLDDAKDILKDSISLEETSPVRVDTIMRVVAAKYSLDVKDLKGQQKTAAVVLPRQLAMYLATVMTDMATTTIGKAFGGRDHSTVIHAKKKIVKEIEANPWFNELVNKLQADIRVVENQ